MTTRSSLMREDDRTGVSETRPDRQYRMPPCPIHSQFRVVGHDLGGTTHRTCPLSDFEPRSTWLKGATWEIPVYIIVRHYRPLGNVLRQLDRREKPKEGDVAKALVQALNLPFYAFMRVSSVHGPLAAIAVLSVLNLVMQTGFQNWQILSFAAMVFFFASPTYAIFEYFAISRYIVLIVEGLWPYCGTFDSEHQGKLVAIRLKSKLLYLAIFVTSLPLLFLAVRSSSKSTCCSPISRSTRRANTCCRFGCGSSVSSPSA